MRVFISYARADQAHAKRLFDDLSRIADVDPWLDTESLLPGDKWEAEILKAIDGAAFVILVHSEHTVAKDGYIQKEIREALARFEKVPPGRRYLIVARVDETEPTHDELRSVTWCDLFPDWDAGTQRIARSIAATQSRLGSLDDFVEFADQSNRGILDLIRSHPRVDEILADMFAVYSNQRYPEAMAITGEILHSPVYDRRATSDPAHGLLFPKVVLNPPRIMVMDIYLVKGIDEQGQSYLLQYFSGTAATGWKTWLFPHGMGFQRNIVNARDRLDLDARDFEITTGLPERSTRIEYDSSGAYVVGVKPDFGYRNELVMYVFLYCNVEIAALGESGLNSLEFTVPRGRYRRHYRWFHMDELLDDVDIWAKNADVLKGIHTLFGTSLLQVPLSLDRALDTSTQDAGEAAGPDDGWGDHPLQQA